MNTSNMISKRGASDIIAWVLLLGFAIASAAMVYNWSIQQTEEMSEHTVTFVEGDLKCADVRINVITKGSTNPCSLIDIYNQGYHTIQQFSIRWEKADGVVGSNEITTSLAPNQNYERNVACGSACEEISIVPIVDVDGKLVGCKDRAITIKQCSA